MKNKDHKRYEDMPSIPTETDSGMWIGTIIVIIAFIAGVAIGWFAKPNKVDTVVQNRYSSEHEDFADICANFLSKQRLENCGNWEAGYMEGFNARIK